MHHILQLWWMKQPTTIIMSKLIVMCFRWVSNDFEIHAEFADLHVVESIDAITIIHSVLMRMHLPINQVRCQCYDGTGTHFEIATQLAHKVPRAVEVQGDERLLGYHA